MNACTLPNNLGDALAEALRAACSNDDAEVAMRLFNIWHRRHERMSETRRSITVDPG